MGSLLSKIRDEHHAFENWCEKNGYPLPSREYWDHPKYQEYEDYLDPPEQRKIRAQKHEEYKNSFKDKVGVLDLDFWYGADISKYKCDKCNTTLIYKSGFILTDEYGCPGCGHTEGGTY